MRHGETKKNNSVKRLIDYYIINDLVKLNTIFHHRDIYKFTREERSRHEKSIIDYVGTITNRTQKNYVKDVRARRGFEIGSYHYLIRGRIKL